MNAIGEGLSTDYIYVIAADLPQAPANPPVVLEYSQTSITVEIDPIVGVANGGSPVTGYIVMIDDGIGGDFVQVQDSLTLQLTISNLRSGRSYRIKYAGRNIVFDQNNMYENDSIKFSESTLQLTAVEPDTPENLIQDPKLKYKTAIVVRWTASPEDGGSPLIAYILSITDVSDVNSEVQYTLSSSAFDYTFTGLSSGHQYSIKIKARNLVGDSDWSLPTYAYAGIEPTRPDLITFTSSTRNTLQLDWPALTGDDTGGTSQYPITITSYDLYMDNGYNGDFKLIHSAPTTSHLVQYLTPGLMYRFRLMAKSAIGLQSEYSTIQYMMAGTIPTAPSSPQMISQSNLKLEFYWNEPYDNGGTSITSYEVEVLRVSDSNVQSITVINSNRYTYSSAVLGFRAGEEYQIRIRARNFITEYYLLTGIWSATSTFYSSVLPQTISSGLTYDSLSKVGATIRWALHTSASEKGYSTTIPVYTLEMDDCRNGPFSNVLLTTTAATSYTISSMTPGILCRFRMNVRNVIGLSPYSDILEIQFAEVPDAPPVPRYVSRSGGDASINLSPFIKIEWDTPHETGGVEILGYIVEYSVGTGAYVKMYDGSTNPMQRSFKFQNLVAGQTYNFRVLARNVKGYSAASPSIAIIAANMPPKMQAPTVTTIVPSG